MMHKGTVKWTDINQNYGFIIPDDNNSQNIFIHVSIFKKLGINTPKNGQRVVFNIVDNINHNSLLANIPEMILI